MIHWIPKETERYGPEEVCSNHNIWPNKERHSLLFIQGKGIRHTKSPAGQFRNVKYIEEVPYPEREELRCLYAFEHLPSIYALKIDRYSFHIHTFLRLNISVFKLQVLSYSVAQCSNDHILVESGRWFELRFCGKHNYVFNIFPGSNVIKVSEVFHVPFKSKQVHFAFAVMDSNIIQSNPAVSFPRFVSHLRYYLFAMRMVSETHQVRVKHFQYIQIVASVKEFYSFEIWDGPGKRSKHEAGVHFSSGEKSYTSSTFVLFMSLVSKFEKITTNNMDFAAIDLKCDVIHYLGHNNQRMFPLNPTRTVNCATLVAPQQNSINLTVGGFEYTGEPNTLLCDWAGVAAYDDTQQLISSECVKILEQHSFYDICTCNQSPESSSWYKLHAIIYQKQTKKYVHPEIEHNKSIYSPNNLTLVWYSFKEYGIISANVSITTTNCKVKTLTFCPSGALHFQSSEVCLVVQVLHSQHHLEARCKKTRHYIFGAPHNQSYSLSVTGFIDGEQEKVNHVHSRYWRGSQ